MLVIITSKDFFDGGLGSFLGQSSLRVISSGHSAVKSTLTLMKYRNRTVPVHGLPFSDRLFINKAKSSRVA